MAPSDPESVRLQDDPQLLGLAGLDLAVEVLERGAPAAVAGLGGGRRLARLDHRSGFLLVADDAEDVAGLRDVRQAEDDDRFDGPALVTRLPMSFSSARTRPNVSPTTMMSPTFSVPVWTSAVATGPRPLSSLASTIVPMADRFGFALSSWRSATKDHLDQLVEPDPRLGRDRDERHVAAVLLDHDAGLGQLGLDPVRVGVGLVDLVEGDDDRDLGRFRAADGPSVWGITPSSAATTTTATSVTFAPRAASL